LYRLLEEDETLDEFLRLPPDQILLRWFNYHLKAANWNRRYVLWEGRGFAKLCFCTGVKVSFY
jgi:plastin-1